MRPSPERGGAGGEADPRHGMCIAACMEATRRGAAIGQGRSPGHQAGQVSRWPAIRHGLREAALCVAGYVVYSLLRGVVAGDPETSSTHARRVVGLERTLHVFRE